MRADRHITRTLELLSFTCRASGSQPFTWSSITTASTFANLSNISRPSVAEWAVITLCFADSMSSLRVESPCAGSFSTIRNDSRWPLSSSLQSILYLKMRKAWRQRMRNLIQLSHRRELPNPSRVSSGGLMSLKPAVLMITPHPDLLHDRILTADGYKVTTVTSYLAAMRVWQPKLFPLVLIFADRDSKEFCEGVK